MKKCTKCGELKSLSEYYQYRPRKTRTYYRSACKACYVKQVSQYHYEDPRRQRKRDLAKLYQTSPEEIEKLKKYQNSCCAICSQNIKLEIDHDHVTGRVRGLLCGMCNRGLGHFKDNLVLLHGAIAYLEEVSVRL